MAQSTEESVLDKLLKTRYPLTYYLSRQQQFINSYSTASSTIAPVPSDPVKNIAHKQKAQLPPPACFNVPDTLDFNATSYEQNEEMDQNSGLEDEDDYGQGFDESLLLKNISNQFDDTHSGSTNEKKSSLIVRSSATDLEFSPYENSSPLQRAIQNGLNVINK
ncbi:unnamed protein product [Adineta ricciae]|uniref:Uncharacterized protein n=1 Tax=Adineta ricciae TaxID=249248 RepID=A0A814H0D1_ADIRI|nr:unnamed protein product [Adineta ricciae]